MSNTPKKPAVQSKSILQDIKEARTDFQKHAKGDEKLKNCIVPAPQFVIFDPPLEGYEARAEVRMTREEENIFIYGVPTKSRQTGTGPFIVLTPVKRIEDLLPQLVCEAWAAQNKDGEWSFHSTSARKNGTFWSCEKSSFMLACKAFNPFGLPVEPNSDWKSQLYHFTPAQGWKKVGGK